MCAITSFSLSGDGSVLDTWVFEKFTDLLEQAKTDDQLRKKLHSDKIVFFLHLLGLDTNGHSHLPTSEFYINNIKIVDEGIQKVTEQLNEFYGDDHKTAYVFTADHGMGNRGKSTMNMLSRVNDYAHSGTGLHGGSHNPTDPLISYLSRRPWRWPS